MLFRQICWSSFGFDQPCTLKAQRSFFSPLGSWLVIIIFLASLVEEDRTESMLYLPPVVVDRWVFSLGVCHVLVILCVFDVFLDER